MHRTDRAGRPLAVGCLAVAAAVASPACTASKPTAIVVSIATDLRVPDALDRMVLVVKQRGLVHSDLSYELDPAKAGAVKLPATIWLLAGRDPGESVHVIATGLKDDRALVRREARLSFVRDRTLLLRLNLLRSCALRAEPCPDGETCTEGGCIDIDLDPADLPAYSEAEALAGLEAGPPLDLADAASDLPPDAAPDLLADAARDLPPDGAVDQQRIDLGRDIGLDAADAAVDAVVDATADAGCDGCWSGDACVAGAAVAACGAGGAVCLSCIDGEDCTDDICQPGGSCANPALEDKTGCPGPGVCCGGVCQVGGDCCSDDDCSGCVGTPTPCGSFSTPTSCSAQAGCTWRPGNVCVGGTVSCGVMTELACPQCPMCTYDVPSQSCQDVAPPPPPCDGLAEPECSACGGCSWDPNPACIGTPTPCGSFATKGGCQGQAGCHWLACVDFNCS